MFTKTITFLFLGCVAFISGQVSDQHVLNVRLFPAQILVLDAQNEPDNQSENNNTSENLLNVDHLVVTNIYGYQINALHKPYYNDEVDISNSNIDESRCFNEFSIANIGNGTIEKKIPVAASEFEDSFSNLSCVTNDQNSLMVYTIISQ